MLAKTIDYAVTDSEVGAAEVGYQLGSIIVDNGNDELLLERRKDNRLWEYPAGSMDLSESLDETAKRELFEETGLTAQKLELYDFLHTETPRNVYPNGDVVYNVIARYVCTEWTGELHPQASEVKDLQWFSFDKLPKNLAPGKSKEISKYLEWRNAKADTHNQVTIGDHFVTLLDPEG
jgi:8-oxo-dGTP pyrophosphatase MutT (NUDIX family)